MSSLPAAGGAGFTARPARGRVAVAVAAVLALLGGMVLGPARVAAAPRPVEYVVVVGAAGLRWDDLDPVATPSLWKLAERGSIGALSVRSARRLTCPADGWLTLGAGNYSERPPAPPVAGQCTPLDVSVEVTGDGGSIADQASVSEHNRSRPWGARPGALAEQVRCSTAIGEGGAVALARPLGRVDRYAPEPAGGDLKQLLAQCVLSAVDAGPVAGAGPERKAAAQRADRLLGEVLAARPERSLVLVAGVSDTEAPSRLHVAIADGPGFGGGWLMSSATGRPGYLQLVDLAPTALSALDRARPAKLFVGQPAIRASQERPSALKDAVAELGDADREAGAQGKIAGRFFLVLVILQLALLAVMIPVLRWLRRSKTRHPVPPPPGWFLTGLEMILLAAALAIPAALVTDLVPWWRVPRPGLLFAGLGVAVLAALTAGVWFSRLGRRPLGPLVLVAAIATAVVGLDVLTGAKLQLNGVAGYSALSGSRYTGLGTIGFGVFAAGLLLGSACLAQRAVTRPWRPPLVLGIGILGTVLVGAPQLGADPGGAIALMLGVCVAAALVQGGWLTMTRLLTAVIAGLSVTVVFVLVDLGRPEDERGSLGRLLSEAGQGQVVFQRLAEANVVAFASSPLTWLFLVGGLYGYFVMLRPWGGLRRVFGLYPAIRGGIYGGMVASLVGGLVDGAGVIAAGAAAATMAPVLILAGFRVVRRIEQHHTGEQPRVKPVDMRQPEEGGAVDGNGNANGNGKGYGHPAERRPLST